MDRELDVAHVVQQISSRTIAALSVVLARNRLGLLRNFSL